MELGLTGKVALVTGATRGLGKAICMGLAAEGAAIAVNYRGNREPAEAIAAEITDRCGVPAMTAFADVAKEADVTAMFEAVDNRFGGIDVLVNNAAYCPTCRVADMSQQMWNETLQVNLTGTFLCSRQFVRRALGRKHAGRIVNISSAAAFRGSTTGHAPYDASKGGIVSFTVSLAREVAGNDIRVNCVAPGMMHTEMTDAAITANLDKYLNRIPLRKIGDVDEVARVVVFLSGAGSDYMTGATVDVSGGLAMR